MFSHSDVLSTRCTRQIIQVAVFVVVVIVQHTQMQAANQIFDYSYQFVEHHLFKRYTNERHFVCIWLIWRYGKCLFLFCRCKRSPLKRERVFTVVILMWFLIKFSIHIFRLISHSNQQLSHFYKHKYYYSLSSKYPHIIVVVVVVLRMCLFSKFSTQLRWKHKTEPERHCCCISNANNLNWTFGRKSFPADILYKNKPSICNWCSLAT